jgi:hypothetical protein
LPVGNSFSCEMIAEEKLESELDYVKGLRTVKLGQREGGEDMQLKLLLASNITLIIMTFIGGAYVLWTGGQASAGYAVIPMLFALAVNVAYRKQKSDKS